MSSEIKSEKPMILLIDDDQVCLNVISRALTLFGYPNRKYISPIEAVKACRQEKFDVVVTDCKMREMSGTQVLNTVHSLNPDTFVIFLTGSSETTNTTTAKNCNAYAYFYKPLNMKNFIDTLLRIEKELH